jgi:hypothetical protein
MFKGGFQESKVGECHMQGLEDTPEAFEVFVSWLYKDRLPEDCQVVAGSGTIYSALIDFYILADKLLLEKDVKVQALDVLAEAYAADIDLVLCSSTINSVLISTAEDCPFDVS